MFDFRHKLFLSLFHLFKRMETLLYASVADYHTDLNNNAVDARLRGLQIWNAFTTLPPPRSGAPIKVPKIHHWCTHQACIKFVREYIFFLAYYSNYTLYYVKCIHWHIRVSVDLRFSHTSARKKKIKETHWQFIRTFRNVHVFFRRNKKNAGLIGDRYQDFLHQTLLLCFSCPNSWQIVRFEGSRKFRSLFLSVSSSSLIIRWIINKENSQLNHNLTQFRVCVYVCFDWFAQSVIVVFFVWDSQAARQKQTFV